MAKPRKNDEPTVEAVAPVKTKDGWVLRTFVIQGLEVVDFNDSDADTRSASLGRAIRRWEAES
jgi:ribosomal protein S3AE